MTLFRHPPGPTTANSLSTQLNDADNVTELKVQQQKILYQVTVMQDKLSNIFSKQQATYKRYFEKKVRSKPIFTIEKPVYVVRLPVNLLIKLGGLHCDIISYYRKQPGLSVSWM